MERLTEKHYLGTDHPIKYLSSRPILAKLYFSPVKRQKRH